MIILALKFITALKLILLLFPYIKPILRTIKFINKKTLYYYL